jgi:hypothetical protein
MDIGWALHEFTLFGRLSSPIAGDIMLFPGLVHWGDESSISLLANRCHEISTYRNSTSGCRVASSPRTRRLDHIAGELGPVP